MAKKFTVVKGGKVDADSVNVTFTLKDGIKLGIGVVLVATFVNFLAQLLVYLLAK